MLGSSRATGCQCPPWPRAHVSHCVPSPGTGWPAPLSSPYQTPLRGSAAPVSGLHAWFHMWQSLHLSSSCSATAQRSRERGWERHTGSTTPVWSQDTCEDKVRLISPWAWQPTQVPNHIDKQVQFGPSHHITLQYVAYVAPYHNKYGVARPGYGPCTS